MSADGALTVIGRRWLVIVVAALAGLGIGHLLTPEPAPAEPVYEARALITATRWRLPIEGLPGLVDSFASTNAFRERLTALDPAAFPDPSVFADTVTVTNVRDTVAVWLEATAPRPELADRRANLVAETLVDELNGLGNDDLSFALHDRARRPDLPKPEPLSLPIPLIGGGVAGLVAGSIVALAWPRRREAEDLFEREPTAGTVGAHAP